MSTLLICPYGTYQLTGDNGCYGCPKCGIGKGLNNNCRRFPPYKPSEEPYCIPCIDGLSFSHINSSLICLKCSEQCSEEDNLMESAKCTRYHDRLCQCKHGYFNTGTKGKCKQCCSCDEKSNNLVVKKCVDNKVMNKRVG